jgi:hypothetical protein
VPAEYKPLAACTACSSTIPVAPVNVTVLPTIAAGPLTTEYAIAPAEFDVAETKKAVSNVWWFGTVKLIVGGTVNVSVLLPLAAA